MWWIDAAAGSVHSLPRSRGRVGEGATAHSGARTCPHPVPPPQAGEGTLEPMARCSSRRWHERALHQRGDVGAASRRGDGAALSLSAALVLDAAGGAHLLAGGAARLVGISAIL